MTSLGMKEKAEVQEDLLSHDTSPTAIIKSKDHLSRDSSPPGIMKSMDDPVKDILSRVRKVPALGILMSVLGGVAFALTLVLVKLSRVFPLVVLFERSVLQLLVFLVVVIYRGQRHLGVKNPRSLMLAFLSAIFGALFPILCHSAMYFIPVADIIAIYFASPAFITLYTCIAKRENPGLYSIIVLGLALTGVVFVTKPVFIFGSDADTSKVSWLEGCLLAIASSLAYSGFCISCNYSRHVPIETLNFFVSVFSLLLNVPTLVSLGLFRFPLCGAQAAYALTSALTGTVAVLLLILATKLEKAGPVAIGNSVELPAVILFQIVMTRDFPNWNSYLGSALIVTSVLISGWLRWLQDKKTEYAALAVKTVPTVAPPVNTKRKISIDLSLLEESAV